jgi:hypothetical protein
MEAAAILTENADTHQIIAEQNASRIAMQRHNAENTRPTEEPSAD